VPLLAQSGHPRGSLLRPNLRVTASILSMSLMRAIRGRNETARVHQRHCWLSSLMAARGTCPKPIKGLACWDYIPRPRSRPQWQALEHRLTDLGYRDGANYIMDYVNISRVAEADYKAGYLKLMERDADIIVAGGPEISLRAAIATVGTRPI